MKRKIGLQGYRKNFIKLLSVFMVVFPWITYLRLSQYSVDEQSIFGGYNGMSIDFFIYYKEIAIILLAIVAVLWFVGERILLKKPDNDVPLLKGKNRWLYILSGIFATGVIVSSICAEHQKNAMWGSPSVGEGVWVLLGYIVLILMFYNYFANEYAFHIAKKAIVTLSSIAVVLALVEWFYKPLLEIGLVQALVAPSKYAQIVSQMEANVFESAISLTFYNPGYFGGFVCLLLPFALLYCLQERELAKKIGYAVLVFGLLFGVVVSNTTTALYIAIFETVLVVVAYVLTARGAKEVKGSAVLPQAVGMIGAVLVSLFLSGVITGNSVFHIFSNSNSATGQEFSECFEIEDIQMEGNRVAIVGKEATLKVYYVDKKALFYDENDKGLSLVYEGGTAVFTDVKYENIRVTFQRVADTVEGVSLCMVVDAGYQDTIDFFVLEDGTFSGVGQNGMILTDISDAGTPEDMKDYYGLFTGRGYAWVNSLSLLKDSLLIGKGPGNFAYYFKQFDYVGLLSTHKSVKQVIDKPHSAYIQYATEVGLPAMLAFFGMFVIALVASVKVYWMKMKQMLSNPIHIGAMVAIIGFLIYSLINDSMVTVTPMACMMVGILLASCYIEQSN